MLYYLWLGSRAPFIFALGYIWTDYFNPQHVAFSFMSNIPGSLIMALAALAGYFFTPGMKRPEWVPGIWLLLLLAVWITLTTIWSEVPSSAWATWDWSVKTLCFAAFVPFLFKTRVQLEAMLLTVAFGVSGSLIAFGAKTLLGGGRYGAEIALVGGNSGLAEQGLLSCVAIAVIPLFIYMHQHSLIIRNRRVSFTLFYGLSAAAIVTAIGTFERTGLVAMSALAILFWWNSKRKILLAALFAAGIVGAGYFVGNVWLARMSTIHSYQSDVSAMTRLAVWSWCWDYAVDHPWGGGFEVYQTNHIAIPLEGNDKQEEQSARAPHSMYMQLLSEQGFPGLAIFGAIIFTFFVNGNRIYRKTKGQKDLEWANALSRTIRISGFVYLCGGAFQGIAFQPLLYDLIAAGVILNQCIAQATRGEPKGRGKPAPISVGSTELVNSLPAR